MVSVKIPIELLNILFDSRIDKSDKWLFSSISLFIIKTQKLPDNSKLLNIEFDNNYCVVFNYDDGNKNSIIKPFVYYDNMCKNYFESTIKDLLILV